MRNRLISKKPNLFAGLTKYPPAIGAKTIASAPVNAKREKDRACVSGVESSVIMTRIVLYLCSASHLLKQIGTYVKLPEKTPAIDLKKIICGILLENPKSVAEIDKPAKLSMRTGFLPYLSLKLVQRRNVKMH